jgi:glucose-1-phosphate thymidylyltransferase
MRGIILAGGNGTRLMPLTTVVNKHLLPVGKKPMIFYPIEKLVSAGITDILIVTGTEHMGSIVQTLGSGKTFGCTFTYKVQDEAGGIAQALGLARGFCHGEPMCVLLGDNIFEDDLAIWANEFNKQRDGARIILKLVSNLSRYGIAVTDKNKKIREIVEKPDATELNRLHDNKEYDGCFAVTGIYFYDHQVFDIIDTLEPSGRGELEITDVNNAYLNREELQYSIMEKGWTDAGTHYSLWFANQMVTREG